MHVVTLYSKHRESYKRKNQMLIKVELLFIIYGMTHSLLMYILYTISIIILIALCVQHSIGLFALCIALHAYIHTNL